MQVCSGCVRGSRFDCVWLFATLRATACLAPLSMGFSRQNYWSGLPCPPPGDLPDVRIKPMSPASPALQADSSLLSHQGRPHPNTHKNKKRKVYHVNRWEISGDPDVCGNDEGYWSEINSSIYLPTRQLWRPGLAIFQWTRSIACFIKALWAAVGVE